MFAAWARLFIDRTEGIGDLELRGLYNLYASADLRHRILLTGGVGLPTGPIDRSTEGMRLVFPMRLGSGTVSLLPGLIYLGTAAPWSWGAELGSNVRLGEQQRLQAVVAISALMLKQIKLEGIHQLGNNAVPGARGRPATPERGKALAVPANRQPKRKAAA